MMREPSSNYTVPSFAQGMSILVVDYDTISLMYLASLLEQYSYKVTTTELASVALSMIREDNNRFKLVMADINMEDMDCLSFLRVLLKKDIPAILLSSKRNANFAQRALAEGASFFLEKPISMEDLKYIWQHVYKTYTLNVTGQREDDRGSLNHGKASDDEAAVKSNSQAGGSELSRHATANNDQWHFKKVYNNKKPVQEVVESVPVDENRVRGSLMTTLTEEDSRQSPEQEGLLKTKRSLINDDNGGNQKEKKIRSNHHSQDTTLSNIVKPLENDPKETENNEMNGMNKSCGQKRTRRIVWKSELHCKFVAAISALGDKKARPKAILRKMNVPNLTQRQVASHLQKYKNQVEKISETSRTTEPPVMSNLPYSALFGRSTTASSSITCNKFNPLISQPGHTNSAFPGTGMTQGVNIASGKDSWCSSGNLLNAGLPVPHFFQIKSFEVKSKAALAPAADPAPPASLLKQNLQPSSDYADLMKLLDEEEEGFKGPGNEPNPGDVDQYCEWLNDALLGENERPLVEPHQKQCNL